MNRRIELELTDRDINQLRDVIERLPVGIFGPLVYAILKGLPLSPDSSDIHRRVRAMAYHESATTADTAATGPYITAHLPRGGGFSIRAVSERGRQAMPRIESQLLAAGIPWTRE